MYKFERDLRGSPFETTTRSTDNSENQSFDIFKVQNLVHITV